MIDYEVLHCSDKVHESTYNFLILLRQLGISKLEAHNLAIAIESELMFLYAQQDLWNEHKQEEWDSLNRVKR